MKKTLMIIVLALVMAATVAPARSAQWRYIFVTFTGYSSELPGATTFELFIPMSANDSWHQNCFCRKKALRFSEVDPTA